MLLPFVVSDIALNRRRRRPFLVLVWVMYCGSAAFLCQLGFRPSSSQVQMYTRGAYETQILGNDTTRLALLGERDFLGTNVAGVLSASLESRRSTEAGYTVTPTQTATVLPSPSLTATSTLPGVLAVYELSMYDPMIGRAFPEVATINCGNWNASTQYCDSTLARTSRYTKSNRWEDNYWHAVACDADHLGGLFLVTSPRWLVGEWECLDLGFHPRIVAGDVMDFLLPWDRLPFPFADFPYNTLVTGYWR